MMRVFAEFFIGDDGKEYRRKTLLHFGTSVELIGSAVLMNPGSAKVIGDADNEFLNRFYSDNHNIADIDTSNWRAYNADSTMNQVKKIFNGWYLQNDNAIELDGVIQLFNCFYYKNQNYNEALNNYDNDTIYKFNEYQYLKDRPVYLGWGGAGKLELRPIATEIFSKIDKTITPIYNLDFNKNSFYHPGFINRSYKKYSGTKSLLSDFISLIDK
jgi:hypothetical protein